jgi:hypothetical protein
MTYWKKTVFWTKVRDSINAVGTLTQLGLIAADSAHVWNYVVGGAQLIGTFISIWFDDKDKDGTADIFQKEVTTTITSDSPINVETEVKKP